VMERCKCIDKERAREEERGAQCILACPLAAYTSIAASHGAGVMCVQNVKPSEAHL